MTAADPPKSPSRDLTPYTGEAASRPQGAKSKRAKAEARSPQDEATFTAQMIGQTGVRRGLKGGPPVLKQAQPCASPSLAGIDPAHGRHGCCADLQRIGLAAQFAAQRRDKTGRDVQQHHGAEQEKGGIGEGGEEQKLDQAADEQHHGH